MRPLLALVLSSATIAGCGGGGGAAVGDGGTGDDGAPTIDGRITWDAGDPTPDAMPAPTAHHGTWIHLDRDDMVDSRIVFGADGSYRYEEPQLPLTITGTYVIDGTTFVATGTDGAGNRSRRTMPFRANATTLVTEAMLPTGEHSGVTGSWAGGFMDEFLDAGGAVVSTAGSSATYTFEDSGDVSWTRTPTPGDPESHTGTWTYSAPVVSVLYMDPEIPSVTLRTRFTLLDDTALGGRTYTKDP